MMPESVRTYSGLNQEKSDFVFQITKRESFICQWPLLFTSLIGTTDIPKTFYLAPLSTNNVSII